MRSVYAQIELIENEKLTVNGGGTVEMAPASSVGVSAVQNRWRTREGERKDGLLSYSLRAFSRNGTL